ncbi:DUF1292 domain-containing protein [Tumebacillus permanentifrigoris]|uniref:Uncharacterized protein DUF1292 n=1 Tax=Tumebacillus permanentifrigoris TaxID=378543 RepID=A0A316DA38_9BACL|nr:DUF1292 domain-containing protein [Tumebacillus permanentifrigoris]PWK13361.1 uncharacterized protein DUF1292 [Tumebacillus permanentifrigoris]
MRNEIGLMEENLHNLVGQQLHLEVTDHGVYDYDIAKLFEAEETKYILAQRLSPEREGYLLKLIDLGDDWYTLCDIEDDAEWERARAASAHTDTLHR